MSVQAISEKVIDDRNYDDHTLNEINRDVKTNKIEISIRLYCDVAQPSEC